jgi:hypothetical protein
MASKSVPSAADTLGVRLGLLPLVALAALAGCGTAAGTDSLPRGSVTYSNPTSPSGTKPHRHHHQNHHHRAHGQRRKPKHVVFHVRGVPAVDLPNRILTPGAILTKNTAKVCVSGYASSVRDVSESEKEAVYARYGIPHVPYQHEVDHLVSLELGGSNVITNLWPEPYAGRWGARTKDVLENRLHDLVCAGRIGLADAQRIEAKNWVAAYLRYVGAPPAGSGSGSGGSSAASGGASGSGCEPGYSPCLPKVADLDCGDIPASKKPVHVTGSDPYRLDGDGDGVGCE